MEIHATLAGSIRAALAPAFLAFSLIQASAAAAQVPLPQGQQAPSTDGCGAPAPDAVGRSPLAVGTCLVSTLDESDPLYQSRSRYEEFELTLRQGEAVQIDMDAIPAPEGEQDGLMVGFDTYLEIRRSDGVEPLALNDDRPGSLNSTLLFTAPEGTSYTVTARSFGASTGRYVLRVSGAAAPESADEITGNNIRVELPPAAANTARRTRTYFLNGRQHERVRLSMTNGPGAVYLELLDQAGGVVSSSWSVDGTTTELLAVLPSAGRYNLQVTSDDATSPASFDINVERALSPAAPQPERIMLDVALERALTIRSGSLTTDEGAPHVQSFYQLYEVQTDGSKPVTITVEKLDAWVDPVVDVGVQSRLGFAAAASDDDGGGNLNSRLVLPPPHPDRLLIRVRSFNLAVGRYRLTVTQAAHTQRVFIHFAGTIAREGITALTGTLRSAGWRVQGDSGQRIANAAGFNEVRFSAEADRAAAEALAAQLTAAAVGGSPVTTRRLGIIRPGILEVWISN